MQREQTAEFRVTVRRNGFSWERTRLPERGGCPQPGDLLSDFFEKRSKVSMSFRDSSVPNFIGLLCEEARDVVLCTAEPVCQHETLWEGFSIFGTSMECLALQGFVKCLHNIVTLLILWTHVYLDPTSILTGAVTTSLEPSKWLVGP